MKRGFTLVEMLVVIAIVCLLFALLFPLISKAREWSKRTICISNLRQIGLIVGTYAGDHGLRMPGVIWYEAGPFTNDNLTDLYPDYTTEFRLFICPATRNKVSAEEDLSRSAATFDGRGISYEYLNYKLLRWGATNTPTNPVCPLLYDIDSRGVNNEVDADDNHAAIGGGCQLYPDGTVEWMSAERWRDSIVKPVHKP